MQLTTLEAKAFITAFLGVDIQLSDSRSWWESEFSRCGGWDSWAWETVHGKDFATRKPFFDGFVVVQSTLGRANAQIVRLALAQKKAVLFVHASGEVSSVDSVETRDSENWMSGWSVTIDEIEEPA